MIPTSFTVIGIAAALALANVAFAQLPAVSEVPAVTAPKILLNAVPAIPTSLDTNVAGEARVGQVAPLDLKEKYLDSVARVFSAPHMALIVARSAMDQRQVQPKAWGTGADAFGVRVASRFGRGLMRESVAFGVRALDHEDPRYFPSKDREVWKRAKYAVSRTFVARNDNGTWMPAYSRILSDYSMPFIAQLWRPEPMSLSREFRVGTTGMALGALVNVGLEFWPDVKKHMPAFARKRFAHDPTAIVIAAKP